MSMKIKESSSHKIFVFINTFLLCLIGFACVAPMIHVLFCSFSDPTVIAREGGFRLWPVAPFSFEGYRAVLSYKNVLIGYGNTLIYVFGGVLLNLVLTISAAYVLSRKRFAPRGFVSMIFAFTMLFNGGMIPNYLLVVDLGLIDSRWALLLTSAFNTFNMIILKNAFLSVPGSLEESARLDGANDLHIMWHIVIPLSKASIAVITLFVAVALWNSWFTASIYLTDRNKWPIQMFLREILINNSQKSLESGAQASAMALQILVKYTITIIATVPILCIYPFVQKFFVKGVLIGSVKE